MTPTTAAASWPLPGIALGGDYNPEQWPEELWPDDVRLMREAGVGFVTVGIFSWALLEPQPGHFTFDWLDRILDLLHASGIAVDLATATASPPPWLTTAHPQILPVDRAGNRLWPGGRQAWCPSSPIFRERALIVAEAVATRYRDHPALRMWHVSNELGCSNLRCYCEESAAAFRRWLLRRYATIEALNDAWGTTFWSQRYTDVEQVLPPRQGTATPNPTQQLDFARFCSDELLDHHRAERDLLHKISPGIPVTTNFMVTTHISGLDYWAWAKEQDIVSQDHYLDGKLAHPTHDLAFCADLTRGLTGGGSWFLMEHSTSAVNWQPINYAKQPGQLLRNSLAHVARGADSVGFFQWRASRAGAEKFHSAMLPHAGTDTKIWRDVVQLGETLTRIGEVAGSRVEAEVAVVFDWQSWWACDQTSHPTSELKYIEQAQGIHRALWSRNVTTQFVPPGAELAARLRGCRLVVVPTLYVADEQTATALHDFAEDGGHVLITYFSGIADENDHIWPGAYPGAFRDLLGIRTEEFFPLPPGGRVHLESLELGGFDDVIDQAGATGTIWTELTHLDGAKAVASYADGPVAGHPAVTRRELGEGVTWYLGTTLDDVTLGALTARVCREAGVRPVGDAPTGVELVRRSGPQGSFLFVLNHSADPAVIRVTGSNLISSSSTVACGGDGTLTVPAFECAVVREADHLAERPAGSG